MGFDVRPASRARRSKRRCCAGVSASCRMIRPTEPMAILSSRAGLDCGAQNFIGTVLLKAFSRAECRTAVRGLLYIEEIFPRFKPHKARSSPAPRAAGNRGYRGWLE